MSRKTHFGNGIQRNKSSKKMRQYKKKKKDKWYKTSKVGWQ